jgi:hypothetical protein
MWVATLTLLHAVYAKAWGLGDEGFCALLTLVRALGGGGTEEAYVCGGREGREYIWVHEEAFGAKRRCSSGPVNHGPASGEGADEKREAEAPKGQARKRPPVVMRGLSRAESIADEWSSSDEDGSASDTASEPTLEQQEEDEDEGDESFEAIDQVREDEEEEMVDDVMRLASTGQTDEGEGEGTGTEAMGRFDTRQLRHATQRLLQGGAMPPTVPSSEQGRVRPRLQCLVLGVRAFLEAKPLPQLLRRHARGRCTWRLAVVLEHLVPSRFKGLVSPTRGYTTPSLSMRFLASRSTFCH